MKTVGIITRHYRVNYGTMLQAVALQHVVELMNFHCEIIDYRFDFETKGWKLFRSKLGKIFYYIKHIDVYSGRVPDKIAILLSRKHIRRKEALFRDFFSKYMKLTAKTYANDAGIQADPPVFDIYVVGSDQTWNPYVGGNPDAFYLTFAPEGAVKASYAPSVAVPSFSREQRERFVRLTKSISFLSCREEEGSELIRNATGRDVTTVLDPTFLLSRAEWEKFSADIPHPDRYILQYLIGEKKEHRRYVKKLAAKFNLPIVSIPVIPYDMRDFGTKKCWPGPSEFLRLLMDAELVCTDSFHGSALSINFGVPVFSFYKMDDSESSTENSRIRNVFEQFGLESRIITDLNTLPRDYRLNYADCKEKYDALVDKSYQYLRSFLK